MFKLSILFKSTKGLHKKSLLLEKLSLITCRLDNGVIEAAMHTVMIPVLLKFKVMTTNLLKRNIGVLQFG